MKKSHLDDLDVTDLQALTTLLNATLLTGATMVRHFQEMGGVCVPNVSPEIVYDFGHRHFLVVKGDMYV